MKSILKTALVSATLMALSTPLNAQKVSPHLISANAWMSNQVYGGNFNRLMANRLGVATATNNKMDAQLVRIGGWNYENDGKTNNKEFFAEFSQEIINGGGTPIVQLPHWLTDAQAREWLEYILNTKKIDINYFSIGNEPFLHAATSNVALVANYTKRISNIIREFKPDAIIFGLEEYQLEATVNSTFEFLGTGPNSIIGTNSKGQYYIDVISWHDYTAGINQGNLNISFSKISDAVRRVNEINTTRPANKKLKWAITEFNTTYKNDLVPSWATTYSFWAGQYFAMLANFCIQNGCYALNPWSVQENGSSKGPLDLSMFNGDDSPRSTAVHWTLLGRTLRSTYVPTNNGLTSVTSIATKDDNGYTVMLVGTNATDQTFNLSFTNGNVSFSLGNTYTIKAYETRVLLFDKNGIKTEEANYNGNMSEASSYPFVENPKVINPCDIYHALNTTDTTKIEAENFCDQSGIQTENCLDVGGGENIGYTNAGDWITYPVEISENTTFMFDFRLASLAGGGGCKIWVDNILCNEFIIKSTGGWQNWQNQKANVAMVKGKRTIKLEVTSGGWNLNYFSAYKDNTITGVDETSANSDFNIYPNPATTQINLSKAVDWKLFDLFGIVVKEGNSQSLDIQELPSGVYVVQANKKSVRIFKK
jgi:hypothetical protein